jgi:anti-sigma B factor antagonist
MTVFDARRTDDGRVLLSGRFHATHAELVRTLLEGVENSAVVDFSGLSYISSAGLGVLLGAQKRLAQSGHGLHLVNLNAHIRELFRLAGFDHVFEID